MTIVAPASRHWITPIVIASVLLVFATDFLTPPGFAHGVFYLPSPLLAAAHRNVRMVVGITALCIALLLAAAGFFALVRGLPISEVGLANRAMAVALLLATAVVCVRFIRLLNARDAALAAARRARDDLAQEQRLRDIACQVGVVGGWVVHLATARLDMSDEAAAIQGLPRGAHPTVDEAISIYVPEYRPRIRELFEACVRDKTPYDEELEIIDGAGARKWVRAIGRAVEDANGNVVRVQGALQDVSHRKAMESTLAQRERWFNQVADSLPLYVWAATPEGAIDYTSRQVSDYTGVPMQDIIGADGWLRLLHPDDRARTAAVWAHSVATGTPYSHEYRIHHRDGSYRWHLAQAFAVRGDGGAIERWVGSGTDIDDRKRMEEHARRLAERLTTTLQSITEGFFMLDREWRFTFVNGRAETLLGQGQEELLGEVIWDVYAASLGTVFEREYKRAVETGTSTSFTSYYPPLEKWFEVHAFPSAEGLAVYFQDITERRHAEDSLRLLEAAISRINEIVLITEASPIDEPGPRIVFANHAFERRMGHRLEDVLGRSPRILQGPETSAQERARIRAALARGEPVQAELTNYTATGTPVVLELDIVPMRDPEGVLTHFVSVERDVTDRAQLQLRLQQAQRMESIGQLTGGLAHDFNNLLTVILGNAEILAESLPDGSRGHELATLISGASERAATLVQRLLSFARQQALEPVAVDVGSLVDGMGELLRQSLGAQVTLSIHYPETLPAALVDPAQLESALLNLCINSRDAMPSGGRLDIDIDVVDLGHGDVTGDLSAGRYVLLQVTDTGSGIEPDDLPRVFEPFFTTKQRARGTGLGLSMVYGFANQSRGHVAIESDRGSGTRVRLYLPVADQTPVRGAAVAAAAAPPASTDVRAAHILVVEDNDLVRDYACAQLRELGYGVDEAADGTAALALLATDTRVDLLFTDVVMPGGLTGVQLAARARVLRPGLPVLLTSGFADDERQAVAEGVYPVLAKPYRPQQLAREIKATLRQSATAPCPAPEKGG